MGGAILTDVESWYRALLRGSPHTARKYRYFLEKFCSEVGVPPESLPSMDASRLNATLSDYLHGKTANVAALTIKAIKSWLRFNGKDAQLFARVRRTQPRVAKTERVPTRRELAAVLEVAGLREKVAASLVAFSGCRLQVLGNYDGTDGLRIGDLPELRLDGGVEFEKVPARVVVRPELSKAGHQYFTFLSPRGCRYLLLYLRARAARGEELTEDSPVVAKVKGGGFPKTSAVAEAVRRAIRLAGFNWRPYVLRHYFDTQLLMAEAAGIIPEDYRVFWMGHRGDIEHQYTTNKHRLPANLVEDMRSRYAEAARLFLEPPEERRVEPKQRVVTVEELDRFLEEGWEYVTTLPDGRVIVKRP